MRKDYKRYALMEVGDFQLMIDGDANQCIPLNEITEEGIIHCKSGKYLRLVNAVLNLKDFHRLMSVGNDANFTIHCTRDSYIIEGDGRKIPLKLILRDCTLRSVMLKSKVDYSATLNLVFKIGEMCEFKEIKIVGQPVLCSTNLDMISFT